eukprot:scaffold5304_cov139-Skeletonema_dohrnii-CCMP3373.AAC.1
MPHHKKPRLDGPAADAAVSAAEDRNTATTANELSGDVIAIIFGCFPPEDIMRMRRVCIKWRDAAKGTIVPIAEFRMNIVDKIRAMTAMTTALPHLQKLQLCGLVDSGHKYSDGEDPDEKWARYYANETSHDITIISNFRKLRCLEINGMYLNGRYPFLFNFPLLCNLGIFGGGDIKFDLEILQGLPSLKKLKISGNQRLADNLRGLRVLKDTLEEVEIVYCLKIRGDFMDLADFPRLKVLNLQSTQLTGDIRNIGEDDFLALESLYLPATVHGGINYRTMQRISEVPSFMHAIHLLMQRTPPLVQIGFLKRAFNWRLSEDSPDWYGYDRDSRNPEQPFRLQIIQAGSRLGWSWLGWSWCDRVKLSCEINWLDPKPSRESSDYETYIEELQRIEGREDKDFYRGYYEPPNEEELVFETGNEHDDCNEISSSSDNVVVARLLLRKEDAKRRKAHRERAERNKGCRKSYGSRRVA